MTPYRRIMVIFGLYADKDHSRVTVTLHVRWKLPRGRTIANFPTEPQARQAAPGYAPERSHVPTRGWTQ